MPKPNTKVRNGKNAKRKENNQNGGWGKLKFEYNII